MAEESLVRTLVDVDSQGIVNPFRTVAPAAPEIRFMVAEEDDDRRRVAVPQAVEQGRECLAGLIQAFEIIVDDIVDVTAEIALRDVFMIRILQFR